MGQSTFPVPSTGSSTSTVLPINASSVLLDGSLTSGTSYTTTVNGNGGMVYMVANASNSAGTTVKIANNTYTLFNNQPIPSITALGASTSITVKANYALSNPSTWTYSSSGMPYTSNHNNAAYGNGIYCMVGNSSGAYTVDGSPTSWTATTMSVTGNWWGVAYGNGKFVSVSATSGNVGQYCTNGYTWTATTIANTASYNGAIAFGNNIWAALPTSGTTGIYSADGINWSTLTVPASKSWNSMGYGNGMFVAIAGTSYSSSTTNANSAYSYNGTTWTSTNLPVGNPTTDSQAPSGLAYGPSGWISNNIYRNSNVFYISPDGIKWYGTCPISPANQCNNVYYGNGYYIAVMSNGGNQFFYSTNLATWTSVSQSNTGNWNGVYGNGTLISYDQFSAQIYSYNFSGNNLPVNFGIYNGPTTIN
jgi:hypothetical protein